MNGHSTSIARMAMSVIALAALHTHTHCTVRQIGEGKSASREKGKTDPFWSAGGGLPN